MRSKYLLDTATLIALLVPLPPLASAAPPDWLQAAAREQLPKYADDVPAVMLRNEQIATVKGNSEVTTVYRRAYKILRPEGRHYGTVRIYFDSETRLTSLKGWSISAAGASYDMGEKEAVDTVLFTDNFYEDTRQKVLRIPAAEPGAVVGYEYEQRRRPSVLQDRWLFQEEVPVRLARFEVRLPSGWEYREYWANHAAVPPQRAGSSQSIFTMTDIPPIRVEPAMPAWEATAGQLVIQYIGPNTTSNFKSWSDVGQWYSQLVTGRRDASSDLRQKVAELTAGLPGVSEKIRTLASFVQREVRYVAIEIGIGGYQPHYAQDILKNHYGDCKDKATLLSAMLQEIGVESYYVLINSRRGVVIPAFPSPLVFDHAILAIRLPPGVWEERTSASAVDHTQQGRLLFFDPTDSYVPFGNLPSILHSSYGLVVTPSGGELTLLPLAPAPVNRVERAARLELHADGSLQGTVVETRSGAAAADFRGSWLNLSEAERKTEIQRRFGPLAATADIGSVSVASVDKAGEDPVLSYNLRVPRYAASAGGLLLLRPRALGAWADAILESPDRQQPRAFPAASVAIDIVEINLPDGFAIDELPPVVQSDMGTVSYSAKAEIQGKVLRYTRQLQVNDVLVSTPQLPELRRLYRQIAADEKATAVLKRQ